MLIGVVSDTHGQTAFAQQAVRMLEGFEIAQVIHCGDIGSAAIIELFAQWPTHYVLGNVDYDADGLRAEIEAVGHSYHGRFGSLQLEGKRIAFLHGDDGQLFRQTITSGEYDLVCHGHTHVARHAREADTVILNPGALYRANPHSFAIVELPSLDVNHIKL